MAEPERDSPPLAARYGRRAWRVAALWAVMLICGSATALALAVSNKTGRARISSVTAIGRVASLSPVLAARLSAFTRPQTTADVPPADIIGRDLRNQGANPQLARMAGDFDGQTVYLVPAQGGVCITSTLLLTFGCYSSADVLADHVLTTIACYPYMPANQQEMFGILPGASNVTAAYTDGSQRPVQLSGDVIVLTGRPAIGPYPTQVSWDDAVGHHTEPTFMAPKMGNPSMPGCPGGNLAPGNLVPSQQIARARALIGEGQM